MHELGITQGIIDRAREAAVANGARKVAGLSIVMTPAADTKRRWWSIAESNR